jgi:uncharacterized protein YacL
MHQPEQDDNEEAREPEIEPLPSSGPVTASPQSPSEPQANGGPLGCCLGVTIGLLLSLSIAILSRLYATPLFDLLQGWLSFTVRAVMVVVALVASIVLGYLGWRIGKRVYREYELSPQQKQRVERLQQREQLKQQRLRARRSKSAGKR